MNSFQALPVDVLPSILSQLPNSAALATVSLVNKAFHSFATPFLYRRIAIYSWNRNGKARVLKLFNTLVSCPYIAKYVQKLEIRDFPKYFALDKGVADAVKNGLLNCTNLQSLTWTRDGTLHSYILETLSLKPTLKELEVNGHDHGQYNPNLLLNIRGLEKISVIMPSAAVVRTLVPWTIAVSQTLRHLTIICKSSSIITNTVLQDLAPSLLCLEHLHLTGCVKVTEAGIIPILSSSQPGLVTIGLEGLSPKFDMSIFSQAVCKRSLLCQLRSITMTIPSPRISVPLSIADISKLLQQSPLEAFNIYASSGRDIPPAFLNTLLLNIINVHGFRLKRVSIHRLSPSNEIIKEICVSCPLLVDLFIVTDRGSLLHSISPSLLCLRNLRVLHVNFPVTGRDEAEDNEEDSDSYEEIGFLANNHGPALISEADALKVVRQCSPTLTVFGANTRVWKVERYVLLGEDGELTTDVRLARYDVPEIPEQFLVVRA